jgi:F-type H+-transporting ATPase subunit alpha
MANAKELSEIIKARIKSYETNVSNSEEGTVISVADGIASVSGLSKTQFGELVEFENNVRGMVLELEEDFVGVVIFGDFTSVQEGAKVKRTNEIAEVPVGDELIGRIVNPLGEALDGGKEINTNNSRPLEVVAPGIMKRKSVSEPMETGILAIDSMIPIGKGQRELIIGDRKTGKTAIAIDAILNQKGKGTKCIYVSIGQKNSTLAVTVQKLIDAGAMEYTTIVAANASDSDAMQYIAPFAASSIGEE